MKIMLPTNLVDWVKSAFNALSFGKEDNEGSVEVGKDLHVDGKALFDGGIVSNGTSDLGDLEGVSFTATNLIGSLKGKIYIFGLSIAFSNLSFAVLSAVTAGEEVAYFKDHFLHEALLNHESPITHILMKVKGGSIFWLELIAMGQDEIYLAPNIDLAVNDVCYSVNCPNV